MAWLFTVLTMCASLAAGEIKDSRAVYETEINASIGDVWKAFTTQEGLRSWMAPLVEIDLAVGGKIRSNYNAKGTLGDDTTIENTILCFDPERMIALQVSRVPKGFPFEEEAKGTWSVFYFSELALTRTKLVIVGLGYRDDEMSQKLRSFFATANKYSIDQLKESLVKVEE